MTDKTQRFNLMLTPEVHSKLRVWAAQRTKGTIQGLVGDIIDAALRQHECPAAPPPKPAPRPAPSPRPATPEEQAALDEHNSHLMDPDTIEDFRRIMADDAPPRDAPATPEEQAELNSLNAGADVPITVEELREMKGVATRNKVA